MKVSIKDRDIIKQAVIAVYKIRRYSLADDIETYKQFKYSENRLCFDLLAAGLTNKSMYCFYQTYTDEDLLEVMKDIVEELKSDSSRINPVVRANLMSDRRYTPYCGNGTGNCSMPRTKFNGKQFECPRCKWESKFPETFIRFWIEKWNTRGN